MKTLLFALLLTLIKPDSPAPDSWKVEFESDKVRISSHLEPCDIVQEGYHAEFRVLKIENLTNQTVRISWYNDAFYNQECLTCKHSNPEYKHRITLAPKQQSIGECGMGQSNGLRIFSKWTKAPNEQLLTDLKITDVQVLSTLD